MKKILIPIFLLFIVSSFIIAQTKGPVVFKKDRDNEIIRAELTNQITPANLKAHLSILASDEYEGRETGEKGNVMAAEYLAKKIESYGLKQVDGAEGYFQPIDLIWEGWEKNRLTINGKEFKHLWEYYALPEMNTSLGEYDIKEAVFLGYGIKEGNIDNYRKADIQGKTVMMYAGEPMDENGNSILTGNKTKSDWSTDQTKKIKFAQERGAKNVLIISENFQKDIGQYRKYLVSPNVKLVKPGTATTVSTNAMIVSSELAKALLGKKVKKATKMRDKIKAGKKSKAVRFKTSASGSMMKYNKTKQSTNVIGMIEGKHPQKKNEYVFVTAHYDHLGKKGADIFNGADDNGSGTTALLEMAKAFADAEKQNMQPDRTIVFMWVTGEEKGLLGSQFYTENPLIPLAKTMVDVNVDMIGRVDKAHKGDENYIYVIGADRLSTDLHDINEMVNDKYENLNLDYKYNDPKDPNRYYYRSDHYNFAKNNIPSVFFFSGVHDDYHRPSDTVEKIRFEKMSNITRHIFNLIWELGNNKERIEVNVPQN